MLTNIKNKKAVEDKVEKITLKFKLDEKQIKPAVLCVTHFTNFSLRKLTTSLRNIFQILS